MSKTREDTILDLFKARLGITSTVRDNYLKSIVQAVLTELENEKGIVLEDGNMNHLLFCADYATWRYQSRDHSGAMPIDIRFRLNNLFVSAGG